MLIERVYDISTTSYNVYYVKSHIFSRWLKQRLLMALKMRIPEPLHHIQVPKVHHIGSHYFFVSM